jgi:hypothetical protein
MPYRKSNENVRVMLVAEYEEKHSRLLSSNINLFSTEKQYAGKYLGKYARLTNGRFQPSDQSKVLGSISQPRRMTK